MASAFSRVATALDYGPRRGRQGGTGSPGIWLMWPVFARPVLVVEEERQSVDVFEAHVLRLCQAGVRNLEDLSSLLLEPASLASGIVDVSLARRVVERLQGAGLLDTHLAPTPMGVEGADNRPARRFAGWRCFQDAWTGAVWNRFGDPDAGLAEIVDERARDTGRMMTLQRSDFGRPRDAEGPGRPLGGILVVEPVEDVWPAPVKASEITARYAAWAADRAKADRFRRRSDDERADAFDADDRRPTAIAGIEDIGEPEPVLLLTTAFAVERDGEGVRWEVADPFGLGESKPLRERLRILLTESGREDLKAGIAKLERTVRERVAPGGAPQGEFLEAERLVDAAVAGGMHDRPQLRDELVTMQYSALRVAGFARNGKLREARGDVRNAIGTAQVALEWVFKTLAERFDPRDAYRAFALVQGERAPNAAELSRVAKSLGFTGALGTGEFPGRLLYVDLRKIVSACDYREGSLNAQLWAAVLAAAALAQAEARPALLAEQTAPVHPLHAAARTYPSLLMDVSDLAEARDNVNHAVIRPERLLDLVQDQVQVVYRVVGTLLVS